MAVDQKPSHQVVDPDAPGPEADGEMTEKQGAELRDLCEKHGEEFDGNLTYQQAEERIAALKDRG